MGAGTLSELAALKPFPNQYEPYCVFGFAIEVRALCTDVNTRLCLVWILTRVRCAVRVQRHFPGTLLRLPLRTPAQSHTSQLSKEVYSVNSLRRHLCRLTSDGALDGLRLRELHSIEVSPFVNR